MPICEHQTDNSETTNGIHTKKITLIAIANMQNDSKGTAVYIKGNPDSRRIYLESV